MSYVVAYHTQNIVTEETLKQVMSSQLSGRSEEQMQALFNTATKLAQTQTGTIDFIKLLSPVSVKFYFCKMYLSKDTCLDMLA